MRTPSLLRVFALALTFVPAPAHAAWIPGGTPLSPLPGPRQGYGLEGLVLDGAGGAIAEWRFSEALPDFSGSQMAIAAQRVDMLGNRPAGWPAGGSSILAWLDSN